MSHTSDCVALAQARMPVPFAPFGKTNWYRQAAAALRSLNGVTEATL
jgi:hypothetical protein